MIPNISIRPNLDELQEALIAAGKNMTAVSKGVAQWTSSKENVVYFHLKQNCYFCCNLKLYI